MGLYEWLRSKGLSRKCVCVIGFGGLFVAEAITVYILITGKVA